MLQFISNRFNDIDMQRILYSVTSTIVILSASPNYLLHIAAYPQRYSQNHYACIQPLTMLLLAVLRALYRLHFAASHTKYDFRRGDICTRWFRVESDLYRGTHTVT